MSRQHSVNLFDLPTPLPSEEWFEVLCQTANARIERILSTGQTTPPGIWYDQDTDEWVMLIQGNAQLTYADDTQVNLKAGDSLFIPAHQRHRVSFTSSDPPCIWLAVHLTPDGGYQGN